MNKFNAATFWEMLLPELGEKYLSKRSLIKNLEKQQ